VADDAAADAPPPGAIAQGLERLVFFSDAVIAIALTLLAIDLPVPHGDTEQQVWQSFVNELNGAYLTFALSFVVIAAFWTSHSRFYELMARLGRGMIWRNFVFLFLIVIMPFATSVLEDTDGSVFGTVFYAAVVAGLGLTRLEMLRHANRQGLLRPGTGKARITSILVTVPVVAFGLSIPVALLIDRRLAQLMWLVVTVGAGLTTRSLRRRTERSERSERSERPAHG
jgi:uncharacterized membrane protein